MHEEELRQMGTQVTSRGPEKDNRRQDADIILYCLTDSHKIRIQKSYVSLFNYFSYLNYLSRLEFERKGDYLTGLTKQYNTRI